MRRRGSEYLKGDGSTAPPSQSRCNPPPGEAAAAAAHRAQPNPVSHRWFGASRTPLESALACKEDSLTQFPVVTGGDVSFFVITFRVRIDYVSAIPHYGLFYQDDTILVKVHARSIPSAHRQPP